MAELELVGRVANQVDGGGPNAVALIGKRVAVAAPAVERSVDFGCGEGTAIQAHINLEGYSNGIGRCRWGAYSWAGIGHHKPGIACKGLCVAAQRSVAPKYVQLCGIGRVAAAPG